MDVAFEISGVDPATLTSSQKTVDAQSNGFRRENAGKDVTASKNK